MTSKNCDFFLHQCSFSRRLTNVAFAFILVFAFLLVIYSNSFNASWHFDDFANIIDNPHVHINDLSWSSLIHTGDGILGSGKISRPVSYITFGLNYYFGGIDVFGYHVVNFIIHFMTAFMLYLFVEQAVRLPLLNGRYENYAHSIALLSALLWAVNPLQVFAVTVIVQRMASLAALFYIAAMYLYLKARLAARGRRKIILYGICMVVGLLAAGAKENAAMLPVSILFLDLFLIQGVNRKSLKICAGITLGLAFLLFGYGLLFFGDVKGMIGDFSVRGFTPLERLMTQPRVIFYYVSLIFYPISSRLMLIDDMDVSRSLISPPDTIFAIFGLGVVVVLLFLYSRRAPLLCFCILFFLLNHAIEGSFSSLEMVYLHRNYLPSLLLFVPMAIGFLNILDWQTQKLSMLLILSVTLVFFLFLQGITVHIQNDVFRSDLSLWRDNAQKMPHLNRTRQNYGLSLINAGYLNEGMKELMAALDGKMSGSKRHLCLTYSAIGQGYQHLQQYKKAWPYYHKAVTLCTPESSDIHMQKAMSFAYIFMARMALQEKRAGDAALLAEKAISMNPRQIDYHLEYAEALLAQKKSGEAIKKAQELARMSPGREEVLAILSRAYALEGDTRRSEHYKEAFMNLKKLKP